MKIQKIEIKNYRSLRDVTIYPKDILALVGRNNSGKSNVLKALQLFFEGSITHVNNECFYNHNDEPIEIFITFEQLSEWEIEKFNSWMDENKLILGRKIVCTDNNSYSIDTIAIIKTPEPEWLREDIISGNKITEWWSNRDELNIGSLDFGSVLGTSKPNVTEWKQKVNIFVNEHKAEIPFIKKQIKNPKGYPNVLKGALPEFIFIPAVRDISQETKIAKTNPFGQLISSMLNKISDGHKNTISTKLKEIEKILNRSGQQIPEIKEMETQLNVLMSEIMDCDIELEMAMPQLNEVFESAKIYANDGVRTSIEMKGHGMQRSMIFTILRAYAELSNKTKAGERSTERSTIFAIEEPELYLHPQSQRTLRYVFQEIVKGKDQIIYGTQSSLFVDISNFDQICIMRRDKNEGSFESIPTQLSIQVLIDDLKARTDKNATDESIKELYNHAFDPIVNEGFFADKVVIVEGPSEQYALPIYATACGYDLNRENISVVHLDGKGQMDRMLRIFNGYEIPTYLWFDGDKGNSDTNVKNKTLELLGLLSDGVERIDDVFTKVSDNYTVLEYNLEKTLEEEIEDYGGLLSEAVKTLGPIGKPLKNRFVASKLKKKVDNGESIEDVLPTTIVNIITNIMKLKYTGSILAKLEE